MAKPRTSQGKEDEWIGPKYTLVHGIRVPTWALDPNFAEDLERFQTRKDDVFVASYPKSGTTWTREILWQIYNDGATSDLPIHSRVFYFEEHPLLRASTQTYHQDKSYPAFKPVIDLLPSPRLFVSHLPFHVIPKGKDDSTACKYVYVARNPKDVAVSFYYAMFPLFNAKGDDVSALPFNKFAKLFLEGKLAFNSWFDHVLGWWKQRDKPNVLFLKYEDMKKDLPSCIKRVAEFLEKPLTEEVIQQIAHQCSFGEMAKNPASYQVIPGNDEISFLRKGVIGDWKNHMTPDMSKKFETEFAAKLREHGLEFDR